MATAPAQAAVPPPAFDVRRGRHTSTIRIANWTITATKRPILNGKEIEAAEKALNLPLPEMTFGNNSLSLVYNPDGPGPSSRPRITQQDVLSESDDQADSARARASERYELRFDTLGALGQVATGEGWAERVGGGVKVSMAEKWKARSAAPNSLGEAPIAPIPVKPHDWTFSTTYAGSTSAPTPAFQPSDTHEIPVKLLARQDPIRDQILFYEDVPLYEDELHDHGESILNVRIRVMPHSFFILSRLFLRVDDVLFRLFDVRTYHAFGSGEVIRECSGLEAGYEDIKRRLKKPTDLSPLTDPNFVSSVMTALCSGGGSAGTEGKPWPGLGKKVEVWRLPANGGVGSLATEMQSVRLHS